ncbi:MAG: peptidyl-prolyl cis-trans isomerase [Eubacterium sp.]|nr:peptidyl-prolyl cis-trans isomerase [Eubacterium sp.]
MKRFISRMTGAVLTGALLLSSLTGCGFSTVTDPETVCATYGDKEISYGFANFCVQLTQVYYDSYYTYFYGEDFWTMDVSESGDGSELLSDTVKEEVATEIEQMYRLEEHAADYGVELTDDELAAIDEAAAQFMEDNNDTAIEKLTATEEIVAEYLRLSTIADRVTEAIQEEADTSGVTMEDAACRTFTYAEIDLGGYYDDDGNYVEYSDDEVTAVTASGDAFAAEVATTAGTTTDTSASGDAEEEDLFESIADDYGYTVDEYSYNEGDDGMDSAVLEAADALSEGEISDPITVDDTIYIIRLDSEYDEEATLDKYDELVEEAKEAYFDEVFAGYQEEVEFTWVESVWNKISFDGLYETESSEDDTTEVETETTSGDASGDSSGDTVTIDSDDIVYE